MKIWLAVIAAVAVAGAGIGVAAADSTRRVIRLHPGDIVTAGGLRCSYQLEARTPEFLCSRAPRARSPFEVSIFRDSVAVFKMGYPDDPVFSRRFP